MSDNKEAELQKVFLKGDVVEDVRPLVKRGVDIADSFLRLAENTLCLPADYVSAHLDIFRKRYNDKFNEIPYELRQEPSLIGITTRSFCS